MDMRAGGAGRTSVDSEASPVESVGTVLASERVGGDSSGGGERQGEGEAAREKEKQSEGSSNEHSDSARDREKEKQGGDLGEGTKRGINLSRPSQFKG